MTERTLPIRWILICLLATLLIACPASAQDLGGDDDSGGDSKTTETTETSEDSEDTVTTTSNPKQPGPCGGEMSWQFFAIIGGVMVLFWFMGRGKRKTEASRKEMLSNIKKGDKVTSIGGIMGTVVDAREDELVVKVDDSTRMKFARWAIRGVGDDAKTENPDAAAKDKDKDADADKK